ncbi:Lrp/AsnC family transcriptional regulator [Brevibacterium sp.]|uniref:Lrp/AsnC family transcriptional regulator n=1 Tax=Brevibacterium sp. TaxID=1701 RepID=UPI0025BDEC26|nr:Lrp/AsnC family transcriptional regulator [Brevibacterium sp.]
MNSSLIDNHRPESADVRLAEVDLALLRELSADARISNKELASRVGLAPSTCSGRVHALRKRGVLRGFRAEIDYEMLGLHVFGMISVRMTPVGRSQLAAVIERLLGVPETLEVYQISGDRDLLVHVATDHPTGLHRFIERHLSDPTIAHTQTSLVFGHHRS